MLADDQPSRQEFHLNVDAEQQPVELLASETGFSKQLVKKIMQSGAVWLTQGKQTRRLRRAKKSVASGSTLHLYYDPKVQQAEIPEPQLLADEGDYSVWVKPCGMLSQGSKWGDRGTIARWSEKHLQPERPAFIVHRLDRATRGLILIAHSKKAVRALTAMFEQRALEKYYRAKVYGDHSQYPQPQSIAEPIDGRSALSHVSCVETEPSGQFSIVDVHIETGRKHQIRRHLASVGLPIVGDRLYGSSEETQDLQLAAKLLQFICPLTEQPRCYQLPEEYLPSLS